MNTSNLKALLIAAFFFILVGLTHFGTFAFALLMGALFLMFRFRIKAIIPIVLLLISSLYLIYLFDPVRSARLLLAWQGAFDHLPSPPQLILSAINLAIAIYFYLTFRKFKHNFNTINKTIVLTLIALLIAISLPIMDPQASNRMNAFLFIPIVLLVYLFLPIISLRSKRIISVLLSLISLISVGFILSVSPPPEMSEKAFKDFEQMKPFITNPNNTVIVSRHNLEFWVAWALEVDVSQESKFNDTLIDEYNDIFIINQIREVGTRMHPGQGDEKRNHFDEPLVPTNSTLIYSSEYFKLYRYYKEIE